MSASLVDFLHALASSRQLNSRQLPSDGFTDCENMCLYAGRIRILWPMLGGAVRRVFDLGKIMSQSGRHVPNNLSMDIIVNKGGFKPLMKKVSLISYSFLMILMHIKVFKSSLKNGKPV